MSRIFGLALLTAITWVGEVHAQISLDVETGFVSNGYNDIRIPGDGGTLFSFSEELEAESGPFYRIRLVYHFNDRHHLGALYAPLTVQSSGQLDRNLVFEDETLPANVPLEASYTFNSYRLFYRYTFLQREKLEADIGFTAKIRDAKIAVEGDGREGVKTNVGFVPILGFRLLWSFTDKVAFLLDGDALAAPQGRAEDVLVALLFNVSDKVQVKAGYRLVEGGADNDEVYNFTLINYASAGAIISF